MSTPVDWLRELSHGWPMLRQPAATEVTTLPVAQTADGAQVRIVIDGAGSRHLLVPTSAGDEPEQDVDAGSLMLHIRTFTFGGVPRRHLDIVCINSDAFDLFDDVLVDVLTALSGGVARPAATAALVVRRWRDLMATRRQRMLSFVAQMSLFAELYVLNLATEGSALDVSCWRGPLREPHDIVLHTCALEVKALGATTTFVEIHGIHQLEPPGNPLALVLLTVTEDDDGTTLPELVATVVERSIDRAEAHRLLAAVGYTAADAGAYSHRFAVMSTSYVVVDERMPRIVPLSFASGAAPDAVELIAYRVDLTALDPLLQSGDSTLRTWIGGTA